MHATLASRDVDCCLIPESPFYLEGKGGLFEFIKRRLKENGHMVIVVAEGAGENLLAKCLQSMDLQDASGNILHHDVGLWISQKINVLLDRRFRDNLILLSLLYPVFVISLRLSISWPSYKIRINSLAFLSNNLLFLFSYSADEAIHFSF